MEYAGNVLSEDQLRRGFLSTSKERAWGFLIRDDTGACLLAGAGNEGPVALMSLEVAEQHGTVYRSL